MSCNGRSEAPGSSGPLAADGALCDVGGPAKDVTEGCLVLPRNSGDLH